MDKKYNRIVATGLLALMLTHATACDDVEITIKPNDPNNSVSTEHQTNTPGNPNGPTIRFEPITDFEGSVWDAIKNDPKINNEINATNMDNLEYTPLPIQFLQDEGLLYYVNNELKINGSQPQDLYTPFEVRAYYDKNTKSNDVYLLVQYKSGKTYTSQLNPDVYLATWKLKYTLDDDDYTTLLRLDDDCRARLFIQEMDKQYQPEIVSKSVVAYDLYEAGSCYKTETDIKRQFPYIYISNVDYNNGIITYGALCPGGYKFYDLDIRNTDTWQYRVEVDGLTEEEIEGSINMKTDDTIVGECLTKFNIGGRRAWLTEEQAKELYNQSQDIHELTSIMINSTDVKLEQVYGD